MSKQDHLFTAPQPLPKQQVNRSSHLQCQQSLEVLLGTTINTDLSGICAGSTLSAASHLPEWLEGFDDPSSYVLFGALTLRARCRQSVS